MYINPESLLTAAKDMAAATDLRKNKNIGASNDMLCFCFMQQALYRINFSLYKKYRFKINSTSLLRKEKPQFRMHNLD